MLQNKLKKVENANNIQPLLVYNSINSNIYTRDISYSNINNYCFNKDYNHDGALVSYGSIIKNNKFNYVFYVVNMFSSFDCLIICDSNDMSYVNYIYLTLMKTIMDTSIRTYDYELEYIINCKLSKLVCDSNKYNVAINQKLQKKVNFIWFFYNNYKLNNESIQCAISWLTNNPAYEFHLWTNLSDQDKYNEAINDLSDQNKNIISKINVHYYDEYKELTGKYIENMQIQSDFLKNKLYSPNKDDVVYITDVLRLILLYEYGDIYADFNDCFSNGNMDILFDIYDANRIIVGNEQLFRSNNFIICCKKGNKTMLTFINKILNDIAKFEIMVNDDELHTFIINYINNPNKRKFLMNELQQNDNLYQKYKDNIMAFNVYVSKQKKVTDNTMNAVMQNGVIKFTNIGFLIDKLNKDSFETIPNCTGNLLITHKFDAAWVTY